ncbi:MAG: aminodeoxychorismate synthase component I [bacterium]|nr:aminodeoxychorismate synthase component I [bacterium]
MIKEKFPVACLQGDGWGSDAEILIDSWLRIIRADSIEQVLPALEELSILPENHIAVGYIAYEAAAAFHLPVKPLEGKDLPLLCFGVIQSDSIRRCHLASIESSENEFIEFQINSDQNDYEKSLDKISKYIEFGYTYQVNYTVREHLKSNHHPYRFFQRLYHNQPAPYSIYLSFDDLQILSMSPELFLYRQGNLLTTRPMKGTRPRGRFTTEDQEIENELISSEKDCAENIMIVDMARNDLGRICHYGSVKAIDLFSVERYHTVHQMTGTVRGELRDEVRLPEIFRACFPAASITGAPKHQTMRIIRDLEKTPRGPYCGAIGIIQSNGDFTFNVPIRTLWGRHRVFQVGLGGGIVWDSKPDREWAELHTKSRFITDTQPTFSLIETLLLDREQHYVYETEHLDRMADSSAYWGRLFNPDSARRMLHEYAESVPSPPVAVRLELKPDGEISITHRALTQAPSEPVVGISPVPVDSQNRFLFHKTTVRDLYNQQRDKGIQLGWFDTLFVNENGFLTEGAITNIVYQIDNQWFTPCLNDGLLPGVWRAEMIKNLGVKERSLRLNELNRLDEFLLGNSVIGSIKIQKIDHGFISISI